MTLPTRTIQQQRQEEARELHELLWKAYRDPSIGRVFLASTHAQAGRDLVKLSGNLHRFWSSRGYRLRCRQVQDGSGFHVWLEAFADTPARPYRRAAWREGAA